MTISIKRVLLLIVVWNFAFSLPLKAELKVVSNQNLSTENVSEEEVSNETESLLHLEQLLESISEKKRLVKNLKTKLSGNKDDLQLKQELQDTLNDLDVLEESFEQLAVGGISIEVPTEETKNKDWREELALLVKPLLENLNKLTEKPRKQEYFRLEIDTQKEIIKSADDALNNLETLISNEESKAISKDLTKVKKKWLGVKEDAERKLQLSEFELENLNNDGTYSLRNFWNSLIKFSQERGLTLLIAFLVSMFVWGFSRVLQWLLEKNDKHKHSLRTSYRIIRYSQRLITALLIILSIFVVFFVRGDFLLLALMFLVVFAGALGLKNILPQFFTESRLLLNIGSVRENELVMVNGIPWRVASINVFSKLINPELRGVLRLPLSELKDLVSRPITSEKWFSSSIGDWVLDGDRLYEVIEQTPDAVELQSAQGTNKLVPTADYYASGFVNLTRSKRIRIVGRFGVDYGLQAISLTTVPEKLQSKVQFMLEAANLGTDDIDARVDFESAGASSLDYIVIVQLGSAASKHYYRIQRIIQQACVATCNEEGWSIPFPQLTVHKG